MSGADSIDSPNRASIGKVARRNKEKIRMERQLPERLAQIVVVRIGRFIEDGEGHGDGLFSA